MTISDASVVLRLNLYWSRWKGAKIKRLDRHRTMHTIAKTFLRGTSMKKTLSLLTILFIVTSCLVIASAQTRRKLNPNVNRRVTRSPGQQRSAIGAGGAGTYASNRRGRYITRNGKRIWVPQGSPRRVYEREQDAELKKRSSNTNRP